MISKQMNLIIVIEVVGSMVELFIVINMVTYYFTAIAIVAVTSVC